MIGRLVMSRVSTPGICLLLLTITAGCGTSKKDGPQSATSSDPAKVARVQALFDDCVSAFDRATVKLSQVVDKASAMSAAEELTKSANRFRETAKELRSMGKFTKGEEAQLSSLKPLETANANFSKANKRLLAKMQEGTLPPEAFQALQDAYLDFGEATMEFSEASRAMAP